MTISALNDVLHYTNQIFSEGWWHPLSSNPLPTHPSPTQTHYTHKIHPQPTNIIWPVNKDNVDKDKVDKDKVDKDKGDKDKVDKDKVDKNKVDKGKVDKDKVDKDKDKVMFPVPSRGPF